MARLPVRPHPPSGPRLGRGGKAYPMIDTMQRTPSRLSPTGSGPLPQQLARMDLSRLRAYRENLEFYRGLQWQEPWRRRERRLTFNYAKTVVEKTASYVVSGYSSLVDPLDGSPKELERTRRAERVLREVHDANNLDQLDFDNEIDCSVLGDAADKVTWDPQGARSRSGWTGRCSRSRRIRTGSSPSSSIPT